jgi:hypothetical protein
VESVPVTITVLFSHGVPPEGLRRTALYLLIKNPKTCAPYGRKEVTATEATFSSVPELVMFRISYDCCQSANMVGSGQQVLPRDPGNKQLAF